MSRIEEGYKTNFNTLLQAASDGQLALVDCLDVATGKPVRAVCAVYRDNEDMYNIVPLAKMFDGNPYEELAPPNPDGGYVT